ncbi:hypothetical protein BDZ89DRAFT_614120 [Hymenopellis radicata]|nr:hypothetical protein BDZ89DRAFT_614120 [Hymenopellis radicata]
MLSVRQTMRRRGHSTMGWRLTASTCTLKEALAVPFVLCSAPHQSQTPPHLPAVMSAYWEHLSELPTPYVFGFALTQTQVDAMAHHILSGEQIAAAGGTQRALVEEMRRVGARTTLVPFWRNKVQYYCYVAGVVPSFTGRNPNATIAKHIIQRFWETFGRGPNGEFNKVHSICMRWPDLFAFPDWLYPMMFEATEILRKKRAATTRNEADKVTSETPDSMTTNA